MKDLMVCVDTETTGLDKTSDRIIQMALVKFNSKTREIIDEKTYFIKPSGTWTIDPSATEVHGLTNEFIMENGVSLKSIYDEFIQFCDGCDFLTYNGNAFDWNFIQREFEREGLDPKVSDGTHKLYDSFFIETLHNSHKLSTVYKKYTGVDFDDAHDACADAKATIEVFFHQLDIYDDIEDTNEETSLATLLSPEGFVKLNEDGELIFCAGKYRDKRVVDICCSDMGYMVWLNDNGVLTQPSKRAITVAWKRYREQSK